MVRSKTGAVGFDSKVVNKLTAWFEDGWSGRTGHRPSAERETGVRLREIADGLVIEKAKGLQERRLGVV